MRVPVEAQTNKAAQGVAAKIPTHIVSLFVEPILLEGEDPSLYWNLVSAMIDEHQPQSAFDWFAVIDLVGKRWNERFYRCATNALIRGGQRQAVEQYLTEIRPGENRLNHPENRAAREANKYFTGSKKERDEVQSKLAEYDITEAGVLARSAQNNINAIMTFDRLASSCERDRRKLQQEMRRRLPSQEVKSESHRHPTADRLGTEQRMNTEANDNSEAHHHGPSRPCQEVKPEADRDRDQHYLDQSGPCLEVNFEMIDEVGTRHHGH